MVTTFLTKLQAEQQAREICGHQVKLSYYDHWDSRPRVVLESLGSDAVAEVLDAAGWTSFQVPPIPKRTKAQAPVGNRWFLEVSGPRGLDSFLGYLDHLVDEWDAVLNGDGKGFDRAKIVELAGLTLGAFTTCLGSSHADTGVVSGFLNAIVDEERPGREIRSLIGKVRSFVTNHRNGWEGDRSSAIVLETYDGLLEVAQSQLESEPKDFWGAAAIAGIVLERHLQTLCLNRQLTTALGKRTLDAYVNALGKDQNLGLSALEKLDLKGWQTLRNAAVHSNDSLLDVERVPGMVAGVRRFISRYRT